MAPRKPKAASTTPTAPRRSARLASRSPSVEPQELPVSRVKKAKATPTKKPAPPQSQEISQPAHDSPILWGLARYEKANRHKLTRPLPGEGKPSFRLKMLEIERIVNRDREEEAAAAREAEARAAERQNNLPSPPRSPSAAEQQQPASAPPATTSSTTPPSTVGRAAGWIFNSVTSLFRKRQAEEPVEQAPSAKRTRIEQPHSTSSSTSSSPSAKKARTADTTSSSQTTTKASEEVQQTKATSRAGKPVKTVKRKRDKEPVTAPSPPSSTEDTEEQDYEHTTPQPHAIPEVYLTQSQAADESDNEPAPTPTPRPILTPKSPRDYGVPSVRNPAVPTSLSTITEYTEPSQLSNLSESIMEDTPSKAPRQQPQSNNLQVPQSTPARRQPSTPSMRRSAQLRAARSAGNTTPRFGLTGTAASAPPKPRESNADTRLAKVQLRDKLQRQLDELNKDEDIMEMDSHRVKRVKIDNLVEIPHNRPGDPEGCFRFPEEDSDDEMEVYENVEERANVFDDVTMMEEETEEEGTLVFDFPDVGQVPEEYHVTAEFQEAAGRLFTEGFNAWLLAA